MSSRTKYTDEYSKIVVPELFFEEAERFAEAMLYNKCAIKEIQTKLEILNDELSLKTKRNPIESISSRLKQPKSIIGKLRRNNWPITVDSLEEHLNDVAGVRVICSFIEDIYSVADMFVKQDDINVLIRKDYIKNPKDNGYRSLHLIVEVPIFLSEKVLKRRVEVQIRTIAMDFWASLEHQVKYKKGIPDADRIVQELADCASVIAETDKKMQDIYHKIVTMEGRI
ncbi:MAG: GTP pyrophosphokinase family protein [Lachnospiraceae bacterium]